MYYDWIDLGIAGEITDVSIEPVFEGGSLVGFEASFKCAGMDMRSEHAIASVLKRYIREDYLEQEGVEGSFWEPTFAVAPKGAPWFSFTIAFTKSEDSWRDLLEEAGARERATVYVAHWERDVGAREFIRFSLWCVGGTLAFLVVMAAVLLVALHLEYVHAVRVVTCILAFYPLVLGYLFYRKGYWPITILLAATGVFLCWFAVPR